MAVSAPIRIGSLHSSVIYQFCVYTANMAASVIYIGLNM
jgi:hypothetical protein